jgi:hypothetical protein
MNSWVGERLAASQAWLSSMELDIVSYECPHWKEYTVSAAVVFAEL